MLQSPKSERHGRKGILLDLGHLIKKQLIALEPQYRWLTWNDSIAAGNCSAGTEQAATRVASEIGISIEELKADILLSTLPDLKSFISRALNVAFH